MKATPRAPINRRELIRSLSATALAGGAWFTGCVRAHESGPLDDPPDEEIAWVCPMHPSFTATTRGACPICGMLLIQTRPYDTRDFQLRLRTEPKQIRAGERVTLFFTFLRPDTGEVVKDFEVVHTRRFHLFVISQDLDFFAHIHPTMGADGTWSIETTVPKPGYYQVLCDFMPRGGSGQFLNAPLVTADYAGDLATDSAHLQPDTSWKKSAGDITATLSFDPAHPTSGQYTHLNLYLTDTVTGRPITDLQPYLGQFSHMLMMSEDLQCYVHSHPINIVVEQEDGVGVPEYIIAPDANLATIRGGPRVTFDALMPKAGLFRVWAQFQRHDQVRTIPFTFTVTQGTAEPVLA
jgi:Heavy metal binding domain